MAELNEEESEAIDKWISDWQQEFSTPYSVLEVEGWNGHRVKLTKPDDDKEYEFFVIGVSETCIFKNGDHARRVSIVTADGKQIDLRAGVRVEVQED